MATALYPGRFDPVTNGHIDITQRAASLFADVVIAVYDLVPKDCLFSTAERVSMFREQASVLVRGIRAVTDFEAELDMALMNKTMAPEIESVYLMASLDHLYISGHRIREVAGLGYDVGDLVPAHVVAMLEKKIKR